MKWYASQHEVEVLSAHKYDNNRNFVLDVRDPTAHAKLAGTHSMHQFTNVDGGGRGDRSILGDPQAQQRAQEYAPMLEKFRNEMALARGAATHADLLSPGALVAEKWLGVDTPTRPTDPPGLRGQREGTVLMQNVEIPAWPGNERPTQTPPDRKPDERAVIPPKPEYMQRAADPQASAEPAVRTTQDLMNGLSPTDRKHYDQAHLIGQRLGLPQDQAENLAMATTARIKEDPLIQHADRMVVMQGRGENGGDRIYASFHPHGDKEPIFNTFIDVDRAAQTPALESAKKIETIALTQTQEQQRQQALAQSQDGQARELRMG